METDRTVVCCGLIELQLQQPVAMVVFIFRPSAPPLQIKCLRFCFLLFLYLGIHDMRGSSLPLPVLYILRGKKLVTGQLPSTTPVSSRALVLSWWLDG